MKHPFKRDDALRVATEILDILKPSTERIEICGSLRRGKPEVHDIEILYIPKIELSGDDLFNPSPKDRASETIERMVESGLLSKRSNTRGSFTWGALNKLAMHTASKIPVDLFCEPRADDWWQSLVIRTGSADFNVRLITTAAKHGVKVHTYNVGFTDASGNAIPCRSEEEVFKICHIPWKLPYQRV